ncbi:hypothetical protein LUZ60_005885 [Juncus effusus]|nr:hypothetical protein LUZ60_005885 [Juncus effusus]
MSLVKTLRHLPFSNPSSSNGSLLQLPPPRQTAQRRHIAGGVRLSAGSNGATTKTVVLKKEVDLATLGNLCVDIVLSVPTLPPGNKDERKDYMEKLASSPPDKKYWEAGGNCNLVIAAARLGLNCQTLGHVGQEIYGNFLLEVLHKDNISTVGMMDNTDSKSYDNSYETLLCWVLVDPFQRHGFCSRADFSKEPAFNWINQLSDQTKNAIKQSKVLFCNGYAFDELRPNVIASSVEHALNAGTAVFFDPGPRGKSLFRGTSEERKALDLLLRLSDVLLLTSDEAESLTGIKNPVRAGQELLINGSRTKWVVIKMGPKGSIMITQSTVSIAPAFKVDIVDTVGCGDSFTSAIVFGFLYNLPAIATLTIANSVGAATATKCGAGRNVAHLEKVQELLKQSNINEDSSFWTELVEESGVSCDVEILTGLVGVNGRKTKTRFDCVPISNVVSEVLPLFEKACEGSVMSY